MSDYIDRAALGIGLCNRDILRTRVMRTAGMPLLKF